MPPQKPKNKPTDHYCWNCGQKATPSVAKLANNMTIAFCCRCGLQVDNQGLCQNQQCIFVGQKPHCV